MKPEDYDKAYLDFHLQMLSTFINRIKVQPPFSLEDCNQEDQDYLNQLIQLPHSEGSEHLIQGQYLLCRIVAAYPHLMPLLPRDLLWFFGGDCLHYMTDEEIEHFQQLDEKLQQAKHNKEAFSYEQARLNVFGLH